MTRRTVHRILLIIPVLLVAGGGWGWWYLTSGRFPLAGATSHDFGWVTIVGKSASFDHTFSLRNRTSRTIEIESIRPGCGCTKATPSARTLAPDETVDIGVTLSLSRAGKKRTNIVLMISEYGPQSLWVQAVGRKETGLTTTVERLTLVAGVPQTVLFTAAVQSSNARPGPPGITAPDGVGVKFVDYAAVTERDPGTHRAAHWRGRLEVELREGPLAADAQLRLELGDAVLTIALSERAPPPAAPGTPAASPPGDR